MHIPRALHGPILISAWSNRVIPDAMMALTYPAASLILQPDERSRFRRACLPALVGQEQWPIGKDVVLGRSVADNLHAVATGALSELIQRRTGQLPVAYLAPREERDVSMSKALADWLVRMVADKDDPYLLKQAVYFASWAQRTRAIAAALNHVPHGPIERVIDVGAHVGLIPWLLRRDIPLIRTVELFEPNPRLRSALDDLWLNRDGLNYSLTQAKAEQADFREGADLIMLCQCLFLIAPEERRAVLKRAWNALNRGGVLLVNEKYKDSGAARHYRSELVGRDELIGIMPGNPCIFTRLTHWRRPQNPRAVSSRAAAYTGIMIAVRK